MNEEMESFIENIDILNMGLDIENHSELETPKMETKAALDFSKSHNGGDYIEATSNQNAQLMK